MNTPLAHTHSSTPIADLQQYIQVSRASNLGMWCWVPLELPYLLAYTTSELWWKWYGILKGGWCVWCRFIFIQLLSARMGHGNCRFPFHPLSLPPLYPCPQRAFPRLSGVCRHGGAPPRTCVPEQQRGSNEKNKPEKSRPSSVSHPAYNP